MLGCYNINTAFSGIQKLVLSGNIGDVIALTRELHPALLTNKPELLFKLQIRHFIEMINSLDQSQPQSHPYRLVIF